MSIQALPQTAVRALGSGQALTDPTSVVKELIDNALDARATNITIEISTNTLDVIQVKDNGHGIAPTDRPLVAKPYCTSKLKDERDLALVGGSYLGFRGEALSSALEMSDEMIITTRVEGETVATALRISPDGEVVQEPASHPPGTTVRIANFLKKHPVRKQVAVKVSNKALAKIKQLLHAYAFARPDTRLSLRVIKAKNDRDNWTYAPKVGSGIEDTALKVVGKPCSSQCSWAELESDGFTVQAYLPRPDAHSAKINGVGQYVSVNGRPLTSVRGISRQLIKIYKDCIKNSPLLEDVKDPFLYLSLSCPPGTYDANIEPAKDDVLFADVDKVSEAVRRLMVISYPEKGDVLLEEETHAWRVDEKDQQSVRANHKQAHDFSSRHAESQSAPQSTALKSNMYDLDDDDLTLSMDNANRVEPPEADEPEDEAQSTKSAAVSNPWIMAKMNSSYGNKRSNVNIQLMTPAKQSASSVTATPDPQPQSTPQAPLGLPTPQTSSRLAQPPYSEDLDVFTGPRTIGATDLPLPVPYLPSPNAQLRGDNADAAQTSPEPRRFSLPVQQEMQGTPLDMIPEAVPKRRSPAKQAQRQYVNKPFVPPIDPERDAWFHFPEEQPRRTYPRKGQPQRASGEGLVPNGEPSENTQARFATPPANNTDIRQFIGRRRSDTATPAPATVETTNTVDENTAVHEPCRPVTTGFVPASELDLDSTQFAEPVRKPTRPRRRKASEVFEEITGNGTPDDDGDLSYTEGRPRRRRTTETGPNKARRIKSSTLPLEQVPPSAYVQNIVVQLSTSTTDIGEKLSNIEPSGTFAAWNAPVVDPEDKTVVELAEEDVQRWTDSLVHMLQKYDPEGEVVRDLGDVVRSAVSRWGNYTIA